MLDSAGSILSVCGGIREHNVSFEESFGLREWIEKTGQETGRLLAQSGLHGSGCCDLHLVGVEPVGYCTLDCVFKSVRSTFCQLGFVIFNFILTHFSISMSETTFRSDFSNFVVI